MYKTTIINFSVSDTYQAHQIIAAYFDEQHHTWRKDGETVIVLSEAEPAGELTEGTSLGTCEITEVTEGKKFPIILRVSACKHLGKHKYQQIPAQDVEAWLKSKMLGLRLTFVRSVPSATIKTTKGMHTITVSGYEIGAIACVEDVALAQQTLSNGIGRARRFGFGMILSI